MELLMIVSFLAGALIGIWLYASRCITLSDIYKPKSNRSPEEYKRDAVLQLQNEITKSGAVKWKTLPDGKVKITLRVVR